MNEWTNEWYGVKSSLWEIIIITTFLQLSLYASIAVHIFKTWKMFAYDDEKKRASQN
jgi:hypothetical protein